MDEFGTWHSRFADTLEGNVLAAGSSSSGVGHGCGFGGSGIPRRCGAARLNHRRRCDRVARSRLDPGGDRAHPRRDPARWPECLLSPGRQSWCVVTATVCHRQIDASDFGRRLARLMNSCPKASGLQASRSLRGPGRCTRRDRSNRDAACHCSSSRSSLPPVDRAWRGYWLRSPSEPIPSAPSA
jgi:hypothetical protein